MKETAKIKYPKVVKMECPTCKGDGYMTVTSSEIASKRGLSVGLEMRNRIRELCKQLGRKRFTELSLRKIASKVGIVNGPAQKVKHHLKMIDKLGWDNKD